MKICHKELQGIRYYLLKNKIFDFLLLVWHLSAVTLIQSWALAVILAFHVITNSIFAFFKGEFNYRGGINYFNMPLLNPQLAFHSDFKTKPSLK